MAILAPAGSVDPYAAVGMEYANTTALAAANVGPPALTAAVTAGSAITFDTSEFARGAKSAKCVLTGAADTTPYARLTLNTNVGLYQDATYEVAFWFRVDPTTPTDEALILMRFGAGKPSLGLRDVATNNYQLAINTAEPAHRSAVAMVNSTYPVIVPGQWHHLRVNCTGFGPVGGGNVTLTFTVWLDGQEIAFANDNEILATEGYPTAIEVGCVRTIAALGVGRDATVYIDDLQIVNGDDVIPTPVSCTTCLPILTGSGATINVGTSVDATVTVDYGTVSGVYTGTVTSAANTWHRLPIVQASGTCYYRVTLTNAAEATDITVLPERSFTVSHSAATSFKIGVISDLQHFVTRAQCGYYLGLKNPDIVLCPGDVTAVQDPKHAVWDALTEAERHSLAAMATGVLYQATAAAGVVMAIGNHDYVGSSSDPPYSADWIRQTLGLPGDSILDYGNARIITLEDMGSWPTSPLTAERLAWLAAALRDTNATWKIVHGHYPPYYWEVANESANPKYASRAALAAVLEAGGCNLFVGAHYHSFNLWSDGGVCYLMNSTATDGQGGVENGYYNAPDGALYPKADSLRKSIYKGGYTTLDVGAHSIGITMRSRDDDSVLHYHRLRQRVGGHS